MLRAPQPPKPNFITVVVVVVAVVLKLARGFKIRRTRLRGGKHEVHEAADLVILIYLVKFFTRFRFSIAEKFC